MKKIASIILITTSLALSGCGDILEIVEESDGITINTNTEKNESEESQPDSQTDTSIKESTNLEEDSEDNYTVNEDNVNDDNTHKGSNETKPNVTENQEENEAVEEMSEEAVDDILIQSFNAMKQVSSLKLIGTIKADQSNFYQDTTLTWDVESDMNFLGKISTHEFIRVEDGRTEPMNLELYTIPTNYWIRNLDHHSEKWEEHIGFIGGFRHFNVLSASMLEDFAEYSSLFHMIEEDNHYVLTFIGDDTNFRNIVFLGFQNIIDDNLRNNFEQAELSGNLSLTINKDTFYVEAYTLEYIGNIEVNDAEKDYHVHEIADYQFSHFNQFDDLQIPTEIIENAEKNY